MSLSVNPEHYLVRHQLNGVPFLNTNIQIQAQGLWQMHNDPSMLFVLNGQNVPEIQGDGNSIVNIKMMNSVNSWDEGLYNLRLRVFTLNAPFPEEKTITIYLMVTKTEDDTIFPPRLDFEAVRNVKNADPQKIFIATPQSGVSFTLPGFLKLVDHELIGGGHIVTVEPSLFPVTPEKKYEGYIAFNLPDAGPVNYPVGYKIHAGYDAEYSREVHFTRDNRELVFYKTTTDLTFLRLFLEVKTFNNNGTLDEKFDFELDVSFVEFHAKINLGLELETYLKSFKTALSQSDRINSAYRPMEVSITALEIRNDDFAIVNQDLIPMQRFLRGRNPFSSIEQPFWLNFRPNFIRYVTANSMIFLQLFKPAGHPIKKINIYVNDVFYKAITQSPQSHNFGLSYFIYTTFKVNSINNIAPGDIISFEYEGVSARREFLVNFPQPYSFHVAFQTSWETQDIFEFTGPNEFSVDYSHETSEVMRNYVEVSSKIEVNKNQTLVMNTGFIAKDESFIIDEIISSKKAYLLNPNSMRASQDVYHSESFQAIELIPISSKIVNHQTDQNLVSFDVEFKINKRYADEIYSR